VNILFIGDVVAGAGRRALKRHLRGLIDDYRADVVVANGENAAGGFGLTRKVYHELRDAGVDVVTSGNHVWDKKEILDWIGSEDRLLRPANYPPGVPGRGEALVDTAAGEPLAVVNLAGRVFMHPIDCPFRKFDELYASREASGTAVLVDFHGEATSEKIAFGWYVDGRARAVIGTHTHVPTADERILPGGTAYITDAGMTGPLDSVIGVRREQILERFLTAMPRRFETAKGPVRLMGVFVELDPSTGRAVRIERFYADHGL